MDFLREFLGFWQMVFVALALLIALAAGLSAVLTKRDSRSAAMWVAIVVMVPFLGGCLYFLFGRNRIERRAVVLRRGQKAFAQRAGKHEITIETL